MTQLPSHGALQLEALQGEDTRTPRWASLPPELRNTILQCLEKVSAAEKRPVAVYTSVSKEWQAFFEPPLWQELTFRPKASESNFQGLREAMQSHHRFLIKTIFLYMRMELYCCPRCHKEVGGQHSMVERERVLFENLKELLDALALWTTDIPRDGISLKLRGVHVWTARDKRLKNGRSGRLYCAHRPSPFIDDRHMEISSMHSFVRKQGFAGVAPSITALSVGPSISWSSCPLLLYHLRDSFPCLRRLDFEQELGQKRSYTQAVGNKTVFSVAFKVPSLRMLSIWETRSKLISEAQSQSISEKANRRARVLPDAVPACFYLRELAITNVIDARDFFSYFISLIWSEEGLPTCIVERLVLSCPLGGLLVSPTEVNGLLGAASHAVKHMPHLKILEVWSPGIREGFFFRYEVEESKIKLTIAATWQFDIVSWRHGQGRETLRKWEEVASQHTEREFNCTTGSIGAEALPKLYSITRALKSFDFIRRWRQT